MVYMENSAVEAVQKIGIVIIQSIMREKKNE